MHHVEAVPSTWAGLAALHLDNLQVAFSVSTVDDRKAAFEICVHNLFYLDIVETVLCGPFGR
jgi:hypothetical protein